MRSQTREKAVQPFEKRSSFKGGKGTGERASPKIGAPPRLPPAREPMPFGSQRLLKLLNKPCPRRKRKTRLGNETNKDKEDHNRNRQDPIHKGEYGA